MTDSATGPLVPEVAFGGPSSRRRLDPQELAAWIERQAPALSERWCTEVLGRGGRVESSAAALIQEFIELLVSLIPGCLGPYRSQMDPVWRQAAELYGKVGAMRGLAAGEVIEEVQLLREGFIRLIYADPPGGATSGGARLSLREGLRLSRIIDLGVTHASVGHTDALFFALFHGNGVHRSLNEELTGEVRHQLQAFREERDEIMKLLRS